MFFCPAETKVTKAVKERERMSDLEEWSRRIEDVDQDDDEENES